MLIKAATFFGSLLLLIVTSFASLAQSSKDWATCVNKDGKFSPDYAIMACSAILDTPKLSNKDRATALHNRGFSYNKKKNYQRAISDYTSAIALNPTTTTYNNRGVEYLAQASYDSAIADFTSAIALDPKFAHSFANRAVAYERKGDCPRAMPDAQRAIELHPHRPKTADDNLWAYVLELSRVCPCAKTAACTEAPKQTTATVILNDLQLARMACFGKDRDLYVKACTLLIDTPDRDADIDIALAYAMRGLAHSIGKSYDQAIRDYDEAIKIKPDFAVALNNRAWARFLMGDMPAALADVDRSLDLNFKSAPAHDTRGRIRQALGEPDAALRDYNRALSNGGVDFIKRYQCGLKHNNLYTGAVDGVYRPELTEALRACVSRTDCNPSPEPECSQP